MLAENLYREAAYPQFKNEHHNARINLEYSHSLLADTLYST